MKFVLSFLLCTICFFSASAVIGTGWSSDDVVIWRYWEIGEDHQPHPKILVYNISDQLVSFSLKKSTGIIEYDTALKVFFQKKYHVPDDTIIKAVNIPAHQIRDFDISLLIKDHHFDAAFVNGKNIGVVSPLRAILFDKYEYKYYSNEGLFGRWGPCIIAKNNLSDKVGVADSMMLCFDSVYVSFKERGGHLSVNINDGVEELSVLNEKELYVMGPNNKKIDFPISGVGTKGVSYVNVQMKYRVNIKKSLPNIEVILFDKLWHGSGCQLPVLTQ